MAALEEAFQVGDLRLLITDSRFGSRVGENRDDVDAQGRFVIISLAARNTGATPVTLGERVSLRGRGGSQLLAGAGGERDGGAA